MWKYVTRRLRDTFERSVNHFDRRSTTGVVNNSSGNFNDDRKNSSPCQWFSSRNCWKSFQNDNGTNNKNWNFEHLNKSWIGAITWSSALVLGWYTSQLIHLKLKYHLREKDKKCVSLPNTLISTIYPYINRVNRNNLQLDLPNIGNTIADFTPSVHLISNDHIGGVKERTASTSSTVEQESSDNDLGDVLNSIENRLGLAAIENGQHQDGLNLLKSAANRNHAPAIYNLALCYEMGLGVTSNEKTAMELYRSAAALDHPGALYNLGIYYGQGRGGLKVDQESATRLLRLAAVQGQEDAIEALKTLNLDVTAPSIDTDMWTFERGPCYQDENVIPTHSRLFVDNYLQINGCAF